MRTSRPALVSVILSLAAWSHLPEAVREGVLVMVRASARQNQVT